VPIPTNLEYKVGLIVFECPLNHSFFDIVRLVFKIIGILPAFLSNCRIAVAAKCNHVIRSEMLFLRKRHNMMIFSCPFSRGWAWLLARSVATRVFWLRIAGRGGVETTVDQTPMRGLVTAGPWF